LRSTHEHSTPTHQFSVCRPPSVGRVVDRRRRFLPGVAEPLRAASLMDALRQSVETERAGGNAANGARGRTSPSTQRGRTIWSASEKGRLVSRSALSENRQNSEPVARHEPDHPRPVTTIP
jgi:hypothetical protein